MHRIRESPFAVRKIRDARSSKQECLNQTVPNKFEKSNTFYLGKGYSN